VATLHILKSITFAYNTAEDRILAAINPGRPDAWSCWLTRRLVLALLSRSQEFVAKTSPLVQRASVAQRGELAAFEREAAIVTTAQAMSQTPPEVVQSAVPAAELAQRVTIAHQDNNLRVEIRGGIGGADGTITRPEFQRILQMLQAEVGKAGWLVPPVAPAPAPDATTAKPSRH
jgi:histone H3/H4